MSPGFHASDESADFISEFAATQVVAEACDVDVSSPLRRETKCTRRYYVPAADDKMHKNSLDFRLARGPRR
jgi:hypothetical protein